MVTAMFGSSLCWVRWEVHPKRWNRWKNICKFLLNQLFPPMLEWSDLRNVPFLWAALTWILFVYSLVFVHTLKVGFCFYSDKISSLLASSNDENLHTSSLELPQFFQVWGLFWFWGFLLLQSCALTSCLSFICAGCSWNWNIAHLSLFYPVCFGPSPQFVKNELRTWVSSSNLFLSLLSLVLTSFFSKAEAY